MRMNIDSYKVNKAFVQKWYEDNKDKMEIGMIISSLACSTMCPCVVIAYWVGESANWPKEVIETIERLTKFYGYSEIVGKPEGSPV